MKISPPTRPPRHHDEQLNKRRKSETNNPSKGDANDERREHKILPVTLLLGFLGAWKTTLLKRILESKNSEMKIAIIVNDMGETNLDAKEIKGHKLIHEKQEMIEMHNGCTCCTLRGDLLRTVKALAMENKYDYLVIESTGISEPLPVAQTFSMDTNGGDDDDLVGEDHDDNDDGNLGQEEGDKQSSFEPLSKYARMDTLVTVLDTFNFASILGSIEKESDREKFFGTSDVEALTDESMRPSQNFSWTKSSLECHIIE
jgi:G3E family GTPase